MAETYFSAVIIPLQERTQEAAACLKHCLSRTGMPVRVIMVGPEPAIAQVMSGAGDPGIHLVEWVKVSPETGFADAVNQGLEQVEEPFAVLLDPAIIVADGWLESFIRVFDEHPVVGLLNPLFGSEEQAAADDGTVAHTFVENTFCNGSCMAIRRDVLRRVGGYTCSYVRSHLADADYSMKAQQAGFVIGTARTVRVRRRRIPFRFFRKMRSESAAGRNTELFAGSWGRVLTVGWFFDRDAIAEEDMLEVIGLARNGNYVRCFLTGTSMPRHRMFEKFGLHEHSGVRFSWYRDPAAIDRDTRRHIDECDLYIGPAATVSAAAGQNQKPAIPVCDMRQIQKVKNEKI